MNEEIKLIERKFLDFSKRKREDSPAKALTKEERLVYADYLEADGQTQGAAFFRSYSEPTESKKKTKSGVKQVEIELWNLAGVMEAKVLVDKGTTRYSIADRQFYPKGKKVKTKFYESTVKLPE